MSETLGFIASACGVIMGMAPVLQTRLIIKRRDYHGVSLAYMLVISVGAASWVLYGASIHNWFLIVPNGVGAINTMIVVMTAIYFKRLQGSPAQNDQP